MIWRALAGGLGPSILAIQLSLAGCLPGHASQQITGRATVIDGDTIEIHDQRIRFDGIDAPESAQLCREEDGTPWHCGQKSTLALDRWLAESRPTTCEATGMHFERVVARCYRSDGASVSEWLVREGWALDWPRYSGGRYSTAQADAQAARRGMWRGEFTVPWEWRQGARIAWAEPASEPPGECVIKGNINRRGDRIYHMPGQQHYDQTVIHKDRGQRWFCTPQEAEAAGWRPSLR